ncbi:hypothetical protein Hdeb2414_s0008g00286951 [Helianthus debilis subsp. tardiflorus]
MQPSNLESFIDSTTPVLPSRTLPKSEAMKLNRLWHPFETEEVEFFTLSDVWNRFDEWSAYGAGVPVNIGEDQMIVQYYVPYLSAIQIFTSSSTLNYLRVTPVILYIHNQTKQVAWKAHTSSYLGHAPRMENQEKTTQTKRSTIQNQLDYHLDKANNRKTINHQSQGCHPHESPKHQAASSLYQCS